MSNFTGTSQASVDMNITLTNSATASNAISTSTSNIYSTEIDTSLDYSSSLETTTDKYNMTTFDYFNTSVNPTTDMLRTISANLNTTVIPTGILNATLSITSALGVQNNTSEDLNAFITTTMLTTTSVNPPPPPPPRLSLTDILNLHPEYRWSISLGLYVLPIIIILGTFGNFMSFAVMMRRTMKKSSTCFYITMIAVTDQMVLIFSGMHRWLTVLIKWDAMVASPASCKILNFLIYFSFQLSAWLLVAMTIERFIAIQFPLKAAKYATVSRAKKVSLLLLIILIVINSHFFWTISIHGDYCSPREDFYDFHDDIFPWIDAALYSIVPFLVLLVFNILIIRANRSAMNFRRTIRRQSLSAGGDKGQETVNFFHKLTVMLLSVSFAFLLTSAPKVILFIVRFDYFDFSGPSIDFQRVALYLLVSRITDLFIHITHAINFFLYCITGERFRKELKNFILCRKSGAKRNSNFSSTLNEVNRYRHRPSTTSFTDINMSELSTVPIATGHTKGEHDHNDNAQNANIERNSTIEQENEFSVTDISATVRRSASTIEEASVSFKIDTEYDTEHNTDRYVKCMSFKPLNSDNLPNNGNTVLNGTLKSNDELTENGLRNGNISPCVDNERPIMV